MTESPRTAAPTPKVGRLAAAGFGMSATLVGAGVGHLVAAVLRPESSPVLAIGSVMIDQAPTPLKTWAIRTFGEQDKVILLASVAVVTLLLGALAGLLARRRPWAGMAALATLALVATVAAVLRPASGAIAIVPGLVTAIVGTGSLAWLMRVATPSESSTPAEDDRASAPTRRIVIGSTAVAGAFTLIGVAAGAAGQRMVTAAQRVTGTLPAPVKSLPKLPAGLEDSVKGVTPLRTPNSSFYRVDINLTVPNVQETEWRLIVDGDVENPFELTYDELLDMPLVERDITLTCVSNEVGGSYTGGARWTGVPVRDLLERARPRSGNDQVLSTSVDGYTASTPLRALQDDRGSLLAVGMNGEPLPRSHGYPARLVTPGLYGYVGATKWVTRLTVTTYADKKAYWTKRKWATGGVIEPMARIDTPEPLTTVDSGTIAIGGTAWAQQREIRGVEVQIDDGPWQAARLGPEVNIDYWRQWWMPWKAEPGQYRVRARCLYGDSSVQTSRRATPFPKGASGWHEIAVIVS